MVIMMLLSGFSDCCLGSPFQDPGIPDGETITYATTVDDELMTVVETVRIKQEHGQQCYEITSISPSLDRILTLDKETMRIKAVHTIRKFPRATLDSRLQVKDEDPLPGKDEIILADFSALTYIFRGFLFGELENLKIGFYGQGRQRTFGFSASNKKKEIITINQKSVECYKLEFGLEGFWGTFLPKMNAWYSAESPHYLVRYQGLSGPPGSPKRNMEVQSYEVKASAPPVAAPDRQTVE
jgi:hypothetical protein